MTCCGRLFNLLITHWLNKYCHRSSMDRCLVSFKLLLLMLCSMDEGWKKWLLESFSLLVIILNVSTLDYVIGFPRLQCRQSQSLKSLFVADMSEFWNEFSCCSLDALQALYNVHLLLSVWGPWLYAEFNTWPNLHFIGDEKVLRIKASEVSVHCPTILASCCVCGFNSSMKVTHGSFSSLSDCTSKCWKPSPT